LDIKECVFHARGGQGNVILTELLVIALTKAGKWSQGFPFFGFERRGAPASAFLRIGDSRLNDRGVIVNPDLVAVLDEGLVETFPWWSGLKEGGIAVLNTLRSPDEIVGKVPVKLSKIGVVDATSIAEKIVSVGRGIPPTNTPMLGAIIKTAEIVTLEHAFEAIKHKWTGRLAEVNIGAVRTAYEQTKVKELKT
jgi:2-oxoacid:acceptor oxidoreductase gamma subunit (pyruvate/2-ketoisovalerate family)